MIANPANRRRAVPLTFEQFRFAFANAISAEEARHLYETYAVPGSGVPLFQAAFANVNPWTEAKVDCRNEQRGALLVVDGDHDNTVLPRLAKAAYARQKRNANVTEYLSVARRGHSLIIDSGWRDVAEATLAFLRRFV